MQKSYYTSLIFLLTTHLITGTIIKHSDESEFNFLDNSSHISSKSHFKKPFKFQSNLPQHLSGYIDIKSDSEIKGKYFYALIENRSKKPNLPLLLWTNGGPGTSSIRNLFAGNGPYSFKDDSSLYWSEYGWDQYYNLIFVDHPLGAGFSYSLTNDTIYSAYTVAEYMLQFLYTFYERHPELVSNEFYMTGVSFAGHYLPSIGDAILKGNKENKGVYINLKGIELGNPWVSPSLHGKSIPIYAYKHGIITKEVAEDMLSYWPECNQAIIEYCDYTDENIDINLCKEKFDECREKLFYRLYTYKPDLYQFDIRGECYNDRKCKTSNFTTTFFNLDEVKERLNVPKDITWENSSSDVYNELYWLSGTDFSPFIEELLEAGLKISVEVGIYDLISNGIGNKYWLEDLDWKYKNEWNALGLKNYTIEGSVIGKIKSAFNLTFALVDDAAHSIAEDKPDSAIFLILELTN